MQGATDVPYVRNFVKELSPPLLRAAVALNGLRPPPGDVFEYCELGCGMGDTVVTLAAAHPHARFVAVDLDPRHIASARALAADGGVDNVRFVELDFADLSRQTWPDFDYVCAHGVLSWIAPATVERVLDFAAARLKPGGILSVSYNALPGWAAVEPLRRLMHDLSADVQGSSVDRARHAMAMAKLFLDAGAEYFGSNPAAREMMETMQASGATYAAHEYFGAEWHPMYFADVAAKMKPRALRFAGQLPLYLNFRDLVIPTGTRDVFGAMTDRLAFEGLKDFAINEFFRRDVYVKEGSRDEAETRQYLETTPFGTTVPEDKIKRTVQLRHHALRFEGPVYDALVPRLAGRAATVLELLSEPTFAPLDPRVVKDAVLRLLLGEQVSPMRAGPHEAAVRYNRSVLERLVPSTTRPVLASPVAGTGIPVSMLDAVALRALTLSTPAARDAWLRDLVTRRPLRLVHGDRIVTDADEQLRVILAHLQTLGGAPVTKLVELGVLEPAAGSVSPSA